MADCKDNTPARGRAIQEAISLLPPGADVVAARMRFGTLAVFWDHVQAHLPRKSAVPLRDGQALAVILAKRDPGFAQQFAEARELIEAAMQGKWARREAAYRVLLRPWLDAGGELTTGNSKIGSPCARYLVVAVAIIGQTRNVDNKQDIDWARDTIRRHRDSSTQPKKRVRTKPSHDPRP
jgi:hypothetical protein